MPPLALGEHTLALRAAGEAAAETERAFEVHNEGLLSATSLAAGGDGADPLLVELRAAAGLGALTLSATAGGRALPVDPAFGRVTVDPWAFAPGPLEIEVTAHVAGQLAGVTRTTVQVPVLEPQLQLLPDDPEQPAELFVSWRAQAGTALVLVATSDGAEIVRSATPEVRIPVVEGGDVVVRLEDGAGTALVSRSYSVPRADVATGSSSRIWWLALVLLAGAALLVGGYLARAQLGARSWRLVRRPARSMGEARSAAFPRPIPARRSSRDGAGAPGPSSRGAAPANAPGRCCRRAASGRAG